MKAKLVPANSTCLQLDEATVAAMEVGYAEVSNKLEEYQSQSIASLIDFAKGQQHGLKLAAHALGYRFEEGES
ncbi:hypothetical protein [Terribacillus saccharophilus]|uniref:hypothetical protein n=1 Tax=Terribacillus saccharophilus TaxID=361277 RepID=UPI000C99F1B9|nr:hypothetical protein [Terribacillus goriensis]